MFDTIDYKTVRFAGCEVRLSINHRERSISARFNDGYPAEFRITGYLARHLAIGASVRLEYGGDEDLLAGLYLGPVRLYAAVSNRLLGSVIKTARLGRRVTSIEAELGDRWGDPNEGTWLKVRGHLWDDDNTSSAASRAISVDLFDMVLGKPKTSEKRVVEEHEVIVPLPEGAFITKARLMERFVVRPRSPFKRFSRWVEFRETPAVIPSKGSDSVHFYSMGGPWTGVSGTSIADGVAELVRRVLEQRGRYGGKRWATGVPAIEECRGSHEVSVWRVLDGKEVEHWRGAIRHGDAQSIAPTLSTLQLQRAKTTGGVVLTSPTYVNVARGGELINTNQPLELINGDEIRDTQGVWKVYGAPIGPAASRAISVDLLPNDVRVTTILQRGAQAGVHVNAGPAIGATGRIPLRGMTQRAIEVAQVADPEWCAANPGIVAGAGPGRLFDGAGWVSVFHETPQEQAQASSWTRFNNASVSHDGVLQAVREQLTQLDTTPPGPTEEAEGVAARERALAEPPAPAESWSGPAANPASEAFGVDLGTGDHTVMQLIRVDPDGCRGRARVGQSRRPVGESRPWLPAGDLLVTIARGEARQTIRLAAAPSIRVGAHKDAEIRLIGAHTLGATIEQELGAVFITRRSDNVAVDLLGLSPKERARLRDGAEIQIGQLYTLTVTSAARAGG